MGVLITYVDPSLRIVQAQTKQASKISIPITSTPPFFRWPVAGESWAVRQENGNWVLDGLWTETSTSKTAIESVNPGDVVIDSPSGIVWVGGTRVPALPVPPPPPPAPSAPAILTTGSIASNVPSPYEGQQVEYLADSVNGVVWRFRYRSINNTSSYNWEFIGGDDWFGITENNLVITYPNSAYTNIIISGAPTFTLPLDGDYNLLASGTAVQRTTVASDVRLGAGTGGTISTSMDTAMALMASGAYASYGSLYNAGKLPALATGQSVSLYTQASVGSFPTPVQIQWFGTTLRVRPTRVR